jgi:predicted alpha/beta hydrolase family esterase
LASADVRGAFLVAPLDGETYVALHGGGPIPRARLPWPSVLVASRTDPRASFEHSQALAADWGAEFVDAGDSGGIDADSGHGPWPDGLLRLAKFLKGL